MSIQLNGLHFLLDLDVLSSETVASNYGSILSHSVKDNGGPVFVLNSLPQL